ncbi:MAG: non-canonical purine NTP pyrophosphatase, RdgB/HAM1 family [Legionellales bacterium]|nr:non-canonical purine NTP pyrophosphatase, RdgB/HAM1 family [Legionellales bacterium]|tara:strand:- start:268 stop:855 length:588 start_codon:yes stop_codon:yes gene_type:complete
MLNDIVFASQNVGKYVEAKALFQNKQFTLSFLGDYTQEDVEETGLSFHENALLKARFCAKVTSKPSLGDDSGLCITALNLQPGIFSARFAGEGRNFDANIQKVLDLMADVKQRSAYFVSVLAYVSHAEDPLPRFYTGFWQGEIAHQKEGHQGFGYDPIFIDQTSGIPIGTMDQEQKIMLSHRTKAIQAFLSDFGI